MSNMYDCRHARFDHVKPLTEDELRSIAPSVFALDAHESRSARFAPIPTIDVLRGLLAEGFAPVAARQSVTRMPGRETHTKHMLRLRYLGDERHLQVGDTVAEVILKNANDGTAAYDLMAGLFRIRCLNSLVAQTSTLDSVKVYHKGQVQQQVIEGTYRVIDAAQKALAAPANWSEVQLDRGEQQILAETAHEIRFGGDENYDVRTHAIRPERLLNPRRRDDREANLWTGFNVIQENAIRGGLHGVGLDANNRRRNTTTREIKGIDQDVRINRALFTMAAKFAELKGVAAI
jgi:hypothetical protein